ncbi:uncharacterized protein LOC129773504 [Toxorhynchites rutilus septentrionalis]|uniref:uncharacterized protein LOC129773504 n=1 Tax=Toxorhynchites rutilus septentrionalis TaxID=329112 RepID=UPI00247AFABC|nr:uncharacterized protein LOC129773504 [Toxorhynchites rutilus septentrionalis]
MNLLSFEYTVGDEVLSRVQTIRDPALSFQNHYEDIIDKARRQLGFVSKLSREFRDPYTLRSLYSCLVRPFLETASLIWDPYRSTMAARIESIQGRFVRFALRLLPWNDPLNLPPYEHRCQLIGLETLKQRRKRAKAIFIARLLVPEIDAPNVLAQIAINVPGYTLRRSDFLRLPFRRRDYSLHEPIRSMMECFNDVAHLFDFNITINEFKSRIKRFVFS